MQQSGNQEAFAKLRSDMAQEVSTAKATLSTDRSLPRTSNKSNVCGMKRNWLSGSS